MNETVSELQLFVLWAKARFAEKRILADLKREVEIVGTVELAWEEPAITAYRKFYGIALLDGVRKLKHCGTGPFLLIVVRDQVPAGGEDPSMRENRHIHGLKQRYRNWTGRRFRVHSTINASEFARDIFLLTGRTATEWEHGVPNGRLRPVLPDWWAAVSSKVPFKRGFYMPGHELEIADRRVLLEGKFLNDVIYSGIVNGTRCAVKHSSEAVYSIENEYRLAARAYARAPEVVAMPVAYWFSPIEHSAFVASEWIDGPSLSELLMHEIPESQADGFAADILKMSDMLLSLEIVHRDVFTDNLILGRDGHLKLIDWQLGISRKKRQEDPWVETHWKFHYVVFGVNHDLPPGHWNDVRAFIAVLDMLPQTQAVCRAKETLSKRIQEADFIILPPLRTRLALVGYAISLFFQMVIRRRGAKRDKVKRRLLTVLGRGGTDVDGRDPERIGRV